jgi:outer membrane receptor protein involved in Fe transport
MKFKFLVITLFLFFAAFAQDNATIKGVVTDKDMNSETLPFATVTIKGTSIAASTDENGNYSLSVPAGTHTVVFTFLGYLDSTVSVTVAAGETKTVDQQLQSDSVQLENVVIEKTFNREKETALLLEQKNAVEIKQSIGAQEIARKGISDVEEGLTKITGISKVENRGLFIRGLENRYNNLLINDFAVPSNSPFNKIVPLDLFPTDIVGYMDIFKTFNPDIYGDFAGGTVNIHTAQPTESKTKISFGAGYTTENNMSDFLIASDAHNTSSFFGFGGKDRSLPSVFGDSPTGQVLTPEQSHEAFKSNWNVDKTTSPLNTSTGVTHTGKFAVGKNDNSLRYILSTNYDNKYTVRKGVDRIFVQGQGIYDNNLKRSQYRFQTYMSTLLGLQYKTDRAKLFFHTLHIRSTDNIIQDQIGYTRTNVQNPNEIIRTNQFEQSDYINSQLYGSYALTSDEKHSIRGGLSYSFTKFKQPDRKFINGTVINDNEIETTYGGNHLLRQFLTVDGDFFLSGLAEYNYKFGGAEDEQDPYKLSVGYNGYMNTLESSYRFIFGRPNNSPPTVIVPLNNIDQALEEHSNLGYFNYGEESNSDYKVKINQNVHAAYTNLLMKLGEKFEVNAGVRAESTLRELKYRTLGDPITAPFNKVETNKVDILPSINAKYSLTENTNLRLAASKTITRPVLMEAIPIQYINPDGTTERGNPLIENSKNYNLDLKFEAYPTSNELYAVTLFAKYIDKPIERTIEASGTGSGQIITYFNNKNATLLGAEFEVLMQLSRLSEVLSGFSFGFNASLMYTNAVTDKNRVGNFDTFDERQLQGASPWMINSDLKYDFSFSENWKSTASFVYNVYGERIYAVGIAGYDHIYENPFHKLDFIWSHNLNKSWDVRFIADNLLNPVYSQEIGDESKIDIQENSRVLKDFKRGIGFSLNVAYTF